MPAKPARRRLGNARIAVAYIRVSTGKQALSPEGQRAEIAAWAAREGVAVVGWHVETIKSVTEVADRPAMVAALADVVSFGAGLFVAHTRDRLGRDPMILGSIKAEARRAGATLTTADGQSEGADDDEGAMLRIGVLDLVSKAERLRIKRRTKAALAVKAARGERVSGKLPYGTKLAVDGVHLEADPVEAATIEAARALVAEGLSLSKASAELAAFGVLNRAGKPFSKCSLHYMVKAA